MAQPDKEGPRDSLVAFQRIKDPKAFSAVAAGHLWHLEQSKWMRTAQWFENVAMVMGNHRTRFFYSPESGLGSSSSFRHQDNSNTDTLVAKTADNQLIRPFETVVGLLVDASITPRVSPNDDTPEAEDAAALSEIACQLHFEDPMNVAANAEEAVKVALLFGTAIAETTYGAVGAFASIPRFRAVEEPNPFYDESRPDDEILNSPVRVVEEPTGREDVEPLQDMRLRIWTPMHIQPDAKATSERDMTWICRQSFEDKTTIAQRLHGRKSDGFTFQSQKELEAGLETVNASKWTLYWYSKIQDLLETPQFSQSGGGLASQSYLSTTAMAPNQTLLRVIDVKPSHEHPRGRTIIMAADTVIYMGDSRSWSEKYPERWHPYSFFHWHKLPGRFWGVALLSQTVPLQRKINSIDVLVQANRKYMAIGQNWLPRHAKVEEGRVSGIPGDNFKYTAVPGVAGPERVRNVPLPQELLIERDQLIRSINEIAGSSLLGEQISKSAARAGTIIDMLRRDKLQGKSPMIQGYERFLESIGQNTLIELQLGLEEGNERLDARMRAAASEYSDVSFMAFVGASLRDHHVVKIDVASQLRHSPEAKAERAMQFIQARGPMASPEEIDGAMRAMMLDDFLAGHDDAAAKKARRMIRRIREGRKEQAIVMEGFDRPAVMAPIFAEAVLSEWFHTLQPEDKQFLVEMASQYAMMLQQEQQQALQQQILLAQATKGGGGGGAPQGA